MQPVLWLQPPHAGKLLGAAVAPHGARSDRHAAEQETPIPPHVHTASRPASALPRARSHLYLLLLGARIPGLGLFPCSQFGL